MYQKGLDGGSARGLIALADLSQPDSIRFARVVDLLPAGLVQPAASGWHR